MADQSTNHPTGATNAQSAPTSSTPAQPRRDWAEIIRKALSRAHETQIEYLDVDLFNRGCAASPPSSEEQVWHLVIQRLSPGGSTESEAGTTLDSGRTAAGGTDGSRPER